MNGNIFSKVTKDNLYTASVNEQKCNENVKKYHALIFVGLLFYNGEGNIFKHLHKIHSMLNIKMNRQGLIG